MHNPRLTAYLRLAATAAFMARNRILEVRQTPLAIFDKGDGRARDLKTVADDESERLIQELFAKETPTFAFFGEEGFKAGDAIDPAKLTWVVDPIDGTTNIAGGIPLTAVSIALWHEGRPVLGVVCDIETGRHYEVSTDQSPTFWGKPIQVSTADSLGKALIGTDCPVSDEARRALLPVFVQCLLHGRNLRMLGSAVHALCLVASGGLDAYVNFQLYDWDVAAALLLIEKAGGRVTDRFGEPWQLGSRSIVATNGHVHEAMLAIIREQHG